MEGKVCTTSVSEEEMQQVAVLKDSISQLLDLCTENDVNVPEELREKLLQSVMVFERHEASCRTHTEYLLQMQEFERLKDENAKVMLEMVTKLSINMPHLELRIKNGSYQITKYLDPEDPMKTLRKACSNDEDQADGVNATSSDSGPPNRAQQKIRTVNTESIITKLLNCLLSCIIRKGDIRKEKKEKIIMEGVNLVLEPGKMYLVLGAPGSGKSTLMKMISHTLPQNKNAVLKGDISLSGLSPRDKKIWWTKLVGYIDQIDRLHPLLTVYETCLFAWKCWSGGTHDRPFFGKDPEAVQQVAKMDHEFFIVHRILDILGLTRVKDTFVGDQSNVRGVSGGEKKRVTVAEMFVLGTPFICCDEISTGLDAATTYDITRTMGTAARITKTTKIVSLLQPSPETVSNFDELVLLSEGKIIYAGPIEAVEEYFNSLGYFIPKRMDVADWLQALPTSEGWQYMIEAKDDGSNQSDLKKKHLSSQDFHSKFYDSPRGKAILNQLESPVSGIGEAMKEYASSRYSNTPMASLKLLVHRELLLWWRDKYQIKAKIIQTLVMGTVVGTLFFDADSQSIVSVLFQSMFYSTVGAMVQIGKQFATRSIFYKHQDANLFPTWCYVFGRSLASVPSSLIDGILYGSMVYFLSGLAINDGASVANYFMFLFMMFLISYTSVLFFSLYSACAKSITIAQALMALTAIIFIIFSGFTVQPDVIPKYYIWIYYLNYFAWMFRGFVVNEFDSGKYDNLVNGSTVTQGEAILTVYGFVDQNDEPFTYIWAWWGMLFTAGTALLALIGSITFLSKIRFSTGRSLADEKGDDFVEQIPESDNVQIPFNRVDLTFKDIHYTVTSSITNEKLELLKGVDGVVEAGKMTALMGSSGAGKTTIMDVLAMRKSTGEITGEIRLNGHLQEEKSFRRCMGYVEQFDVQTPQLTIRETCDFSAKLRLEESDSAVTPETTAKFVQQALNMLELSNIQDLQVGSDEEGGLSFEQRKRLSIAVELVANPSILFLDEPTSGLDARAAAIVMRGLKRVALSGRAVCATIHQPSIAVFDDFDSLLLLKRGGEVVFFGDLGVNSNKLIEYFERYDATPQIQPGENPATWMLSTIGAGSSTSDKKPFDYAGSYAQSTLHTECYKRINKITKEATDANKISFPTKYATTYWTQASAVLFRAMKVYFRSPSYNTTRVTVAAIVALLFASVYASQRVPTQEADMNSRVNSMFIALMFLCVNAHNSVLGVFETERNMFYRHKAANMYASSAILRAFTFAELPFIFLTATFFAVPFYFLLGFALDAEKFFLFFAFTFLAFAAFTFVGQMLVSIFRDSESAQGFGSIIVSFTSLFSGILIRPQYIPAFWIFMYWIMPGHYVFEGIFMSQYFEDDTEIEASLESPFFKYLGCELSDDHPCVGTAWQWVQSSFPDFSRDHVKYDALYLVMLSVTTRFITYFALTNINYKSN